MRLFRIKWLDDAVAAVLGFLVALALLLALGGAFFLILGTVCGYWWRIFSIGFGMLG